MIRFFLFLGMSLPVLTGCAIPCAGPFGDSGSCRPAAVRPAAAGAATTGSMLDAKKTAGREKLAGREKTTAGKPRRNDPPARLDMADATARLNAYRARHGLPPLRHNVLLDRVARVHARDLAAHDRVSHIGSDGSDPARRATRMGYRWSVFGENISAGRMSMAEVIQAWHDSPPHRRNLQLASATEFGLAVVHEPKSTYSNTWVLVVGAPRKPSPLQMTIGN